jgi:endoglucanase Acf2
MGISWKYNGIMNHHHMVQPTTILGINVMGIYYGNIMGYYWICYNPIDGF